MMSVYQPHYIPGTVGSAVCLGLDFALIAIWRLVLVFRNRRTEKMLREQGISEEERVKRGGKLGEQDLTDFQNPYVSPVLDLQAGLCLWC